MWWSWSQPSVPLLLSSLLLSHWLTWRLFNHYYHHHHRHHDDQDDDGDYRKDISYLLLSGTLFVLTHISTAPLPGWQRDHSHDFQDNSGSKQSSFLSLVVVFALVVVGSCLVYRRHPYWLRLGSAAISSLMQIWFKLADNCHLHPHPQSTIPYLIFVLFCTPTHFEAFENCTPKKCVNSRQKLPRDKTA